MPSVGVIATGGTIASTATENGAVPTESVKGLIQSYPFAVDEIDIQVEQVAQEPSSELTISDLVALQKRVRTVAHEVEGIVILHGTDTIEETAYFLDVVLDVDIPVVLTGSQRTHDQISPDGPANVKGSLQTVAHGHVSDGVFVFFNDQLHAARAVSKVHSSNLAAYTSGDYGLVAERTPDGLWFYRQPESLSKTIPVTEITATVELVTVSTDTGGEQISNAVDRGVDGIVVNALGLGNVPQAVATAIASAIEQGVTVVVTTRCRTGAVSPVYGSDGGAKVLQEAGALFESNLSAHKARLKLLAALSAEETDEDIRAVFDPHRYDGHGYVDTEIL
ncbi:asparaginase [Haloferax sp. AB510]|uniref:asparaginase n=1 Tax=Haloferax sp. AB510 TaxID=2934172 RepID=UPI00209C2E19|nr:asparaginase [Haloferax sp. AB510]MCO8267140.1 asparaginase [Haloferax sp. AB510]